MMTWIELLGVNSWESIWLPIAIWTVPALIIWAVGRSRLFAVSHRLHLVTAALLALPVALVLANLSDSVTAEYASVVIPAPAEPLSLSSTSAESSSVNPVWVGIGLLTLAAGLLTVLGLLRIGMAAFALRRIRRQSEPVDPSVLSPDMQMRLNSIARLSVRSTDRLSTAVSFGIFRPVIVLPDDAGPDTHLILLHELRHHSRRDVLRTTAAEVVKSVFFFHPLAHALRTCLDDLTEIDCDRTVLERDDVSRPVYADLLLRYARPVRDDQLMLQLG